jgi:hypothetical protein
LAIELGSATVGTTLIITGAGFVANAEGQLFWAAQDAPFATIATDADGGFTEEMVVPESQAGDYLIVAVVAEQQAAATLTIRVPTLEVTPSSALPDTPLVVAGVGFVPGTAGRLLRGDSGQVLADVVTDDAGRFSSELTMPRWDAGAYPLLAIIGDERAETALRIPALTVEPQPAQPGDRVLIQGRWLPAEQSATLYWQQTGQHLATSTTDANGAVAFELPVPEIAPGTYPLRAVAGERVAEATLRITALPTATPEPTSIPERTATPLPTSTPEPTASPSPAHTPEPAPTAPRSTEPMTGASMPGQSYSPGEANPAFIGTKARITGSSGTSNGTNSANVHDGAAPPPAGRRPARPHRPRAASPSTLAAASA